MQSGTGACLCVRVIPLKCWREESKESLLFLKSLQMAVIPSKMHTENQSRPGGHGCMRVEAGDMFLREGARAKMPSQMSRFWKGFPPKTVL